MYGIPLSDGTWQETVFVLFIVGLDLMKLRSWDRVRLLEVLT